MSTLNPSKNVKTKKNLFKRRFFLRIVCRFRKKFQSFLPISPNFIDGTGKLKKDLLDRPFNHFVSVTDNNQSNIGRAKTLETNLKRDFYLARRMAGSEFKSGPVKLRIVLQ